VSALPRVHRHAACPCGSLRPLTACCLPWEQAFQRLTARLAAFAEAPGVRRLESRAAVAFMNPEAAESDHARQTALRYPGFVEWFLQDYIAPRRKGSLLGDFADRVEGLDLQEEHLLLSMLLSPVRAYEVTEAPTRRGVQVKDFLTGSECLIGPLGLPDGMIRSDVCVGRLVSLGGLRRPGISLLRLPPGSQAEMLAYLRAAYRMARPGRHLSLEDYLDGAAHLYHQFFLHRGRDLGGRAQRTCRWAAFAAGRALYRALETARIRAALDRQPELERAEEGSEEIRYTWIDLNQGLRRGAVRLGSAEVQVSAETREDLKAIKSFLETCLRGLIRLTEEQQDAPAAGRLADASAMKRDPAGTAFLRRVVAHWPETQMPILRDRSPQEACQSRAGREEVTQLLLGLERDLARQKRIGRAWVEVGSLWEALALPPIATARGQAPLHQGRDPAVRGS
jgi:hypothetical protein